MKKFLLLLMTVGLALGLSIGIAVASTPGSTQQSGIPTTVTELAGTAAPDIPADLELFVDSLLDSGLIITGYEAVAKDPARYRIELDSSDDWAEYVFGTHKVYRQAVLSKAKGTLAAAEIGIQALAPDGQTVRQVMAIKSLADPVKWLADPNLGLAEAQATILPEIQRASNRLGIEIASASVEVSEQTQVLEVNFAWPGGLEEPERALKVDQLKSFISELWGVVYEWNANGGRIGVGYVEGRDELGKDVVTEVCDFAVGAGSAHSTIGYAPEQATPPDAEY